MIGQTISHYKILEKLGEGGMGVVYKARDTDLNRDVALKFLPNFLTGDPIERERFYHEARAASALNHPNVTTIHEIREFEHPGMPGKQLCLAMEYVEGKTLKDLAGEVQAGGIKSGDAEGGGSSTLPLNTILDIAIQACEGLAAAHEKGIVHRDIKSANLMVTPKGQVKIMDFGLAKVQGATKLTMTGATIGTAAYMSPEQARGEDVDQRTDIFSFGVVLYELLTGRLPFRGEHPAALMYSIVNEEPQPISRFNQQATPGFEQIVTKALSKERDERYQQVDELIADLRDERRRLEYGDAGDTTAGWRIPARLKRPLIRIGIAAAVVVILIVLAITFNPFDLDIGVQPNIEESKPSLAVISFENIPDPEDNDRTGELLTNYLIASFFQTRDLDVVSRERLFDIQQEMDLGENKVISITTASQIARRARVSTMMLASILQLQPALIVTYRVIDVETGRIINSRRVNGYQTDRLSSLADTLALMVKSDLHVTPVTGTGSVAQVTTNSPEAYRAFLEGLEYARKFDFPGSHAALRKAAALDPTFALPHYQLGMSWSDEAEIRKAWELRANTTEKDRLLIEAQYQSSVGENPSRGAQLLEEIIQKYPREQSAYFQAAGNYVGYLCNTERAIEIARRGLQNDSTDKMLWNILSYYLTGINQRSEALDAIGRYLSLAPAESNPYDSRGDLFMLFGEADSAVQAWNEALRFGGLGWFSGRKVAYTNIVNRDYPVALDYFRMAATAAPEDARGMVASETVLVSIHRGELNNARRLLSRHIGQHKGKSDSLCSVSDNPGLRAGGDLALLITLAYEGGDYAAMLRYARQRDALLPAQPIAVPFDPTNPIYGRYEIAWALLKLAKTVEHRNLMDELKNEQRPTLPKRQQAHDYFSGLFALELGEFDAAVEHFGKSLERFPINHDPQYHYAVALLKSRHTAEAIAEFLKITSRPFPFDLGIIFSPMYTYWPIAAVKAHYWLGVAYEQQGRRDQAVNEYETFLDIWKTADFKSAEMQDARVRLTALKKANMK